MILFERSDCFDVQGCSQAFIPQAVLWKYWVLNWKFWNLQVPRLHKTVFAAVKFHKTSLLTEWLHSYYIMWDGLWWSYYRFCPLNHLLTWSSIGVLCQFFIWNSVYFYVVDIYIKKIMNSLLADNLKVVFLAFSVVI